MVDFAKWQDSREELLKNGVELPKYDVKGNKERGQKNPEWLHFGGGNLYRGFHAEIAQELANQGELSTGVIVCETFDEQVVDHVYQPYDNDILDVVMHEDNTLDQKIIASTADSIYCNPENKEGFSRVVSYFENPNLKFTTFTITEKGYGLTDSNGNYLSVIREDIDNGPDNPKHTMSIVTALLLKRYLAGGYPIAMVSTDNFSQNGRRFQDSILKIAQEWVNNKFASQEFLDYLNNTDKVTFPWSMIDRITPNPSESVKEKLNSKGFDNIEIIHTDKHTNIAPFTNTEVVHYLVIEDSFPNGRPELDKAGVILTNRETVDKADGMKVTTCLNPLHTALAIYGCLLGYKSIAEEMQNQDLVDLISEIGYHEGLPVVEDPKIINPKQFIDEVIKKRLPNTNIPDTPQRIASDTSQKVAIRYGETIKKYVQSPERKPSDLKYIPLVIAGWLRYLLAIDDQGNNFEPSPDPLLEQLQNQLSVIKLGEQDKQKVHEAVAPILSNETIFGVDLYDVGLGEVIEDDFLKLLAKPGAIKETIHNKLSR